MLAHSDRYLYLNVLIEFSEDSYHPVKRETTELRITDTRKLRIRHASKGFCLTG